ncbi:MAG: DUF2070 family protein [Thermoplasmata archaeon]
MAPGADLRPSAADRGPGRTTRLLFRAPSSAAAIGILAALSAAAGAALWGPAWTDVAIGALAGFFVPALVAGALTPGIAAALGGRIEFQRSLFMSVIVLLLEVPIVVVGRGVLALPSAAVVPIVSLAFFVQGPALWFRHLTLYGVSTASHARSLPASLVQPVLAVGLFWATLVPVSAGLAVATVAFLALGFLCALLLLRAVDRPLRRGFRSSGLSMMRPLIDHVNRRDLRATEAIEGFFLKGAQPANLRVTAVRLGTADRTVATITLPTVHPGPFGAIGASDLPRKAREALGPDAGTVFVPHTPCDHDLDLPSEAETGKVLSAARELLAGLRPVAGPLPASPLVSPRPGAWARAQVLGRTAIVVVSRAPDPTDDIAFAVADRLVREVEAESGLSVALIDAHNSYIEDEGDIAYGTPAADRLLEDARAAVRAARAAAREGIVEAGTAVLTGYDIGRDGIAPEGMRALVVRAAGTTTAYLLIDGNNLVHGRRAEILDGLGRLVDAAEVMTTDNHVVHEADGSTNPVGGRYPTPALVKDAEAVVRSALAATVPVGVASGSREVPGVLVLGPGFTSRLLTAIGDTVSTLGNSLVMTLLLLLASSTVVLAAIA